MPLESGIHLGYCCGYALCVENNNLAYMSKGWYLQPTIHGHKWPRFRCVYTRPGNLLSNLWPYHTFRARKDSRHTCSARKVPFVNDSCWPYKCVNEKNEGDSRRICSVPGPNALWHIDGHHSLIRWRMVIHGAIDVYSRLITYMRCNTNNRASTVLTPFLSATARYGIPSRVRSDNWTEEAKKSRLRDIK